MSKEAFLNSISNLEELQVVVSHLTRVPYLFKNDNKDCIYVFTNLKAAELKKEELNKNNIPVLIARVQKQFISRIFFDFRVLGASHLVVNTGLETFEVEVSSVIGNKTYLKNNSNPIENPNLQKAMIYYMQEYRKLKDGESPNHLKDLDHEMVKQVLFATYLIPAQEIEVNGEKQHSIMLLENQKDKTPAVCLYTDFIEATRGQDGSKVVLLPATLDDLLRQNLPEKIKLIIINPHGIGLPMPLDYIKQLMANISKQVEIKTNVN